MKVIFIKKGLHTLHSLQPLYELHKLCEKFDGHSSKLYWYVLQKRLFDKGNIQDYLAYYNNQLVGALQLYIFIDSIEITTLVSPPFRKMDVFSKMLSKAIEYLICKGISSCILICNEKNIATNNLYQACGGEVIHSVSEWYAPRQLSLQITNTNITLKKAYNEDIKTLVEINQNCFPTRMDNEIQQRFLNDLKESNRQIFLAITRDNQIIGKLHVREDQKLVIIHEVGVLPAYQQQGFGKSLMNHWLQYHSAQYQNKQIIVEVLNHNKAALALYAACGFIKKDSYNFYDFVTIDLGRLIQSKKIFKRDNCLI